MIALACFTATIIGCSGPERVRGDQFDEVREEMYELVVDSIRDRLAHPDRAQLAELPSYHDFGWIEDYMSNRGTRFYISDSISFVLNCDRKLESESDECNALVTVCLTGKKRDGTYVTTRIMMELSNGPDREATYMGQMSCIDADSRKRSPIVWTDPEAFVDPTL